MTAAAKRVSRPDVPRPVGRFAPPIATRLAWALAGVFAWLLVASPPNALALESIELRVDDRTRRCHVYVPKGRKADEPAPLVLLLHGAGGNGKWQLEYSGLDAKADEAGFVVASPDGSGRLRRWMLTWNAGDCCGYASTRDVDDVAFLTKLLDELVERYNIDPKRVYAAGLSNGGMMCYRLASELSDRIAAIAVVSGTHLGDAPELERPVPVVHFHGTRDRLVPFKGGSGREWSPTHGFLGARATAALWADKNGCPPKPITERLTDQHKDGTRVFVERFGPGRNDAEVVLYVIEDGGHTWPGRTFFSHMEAPRWTRRLSPLGKSTEEISANDILWEFFEKHPLRVPTSAPAANAAKPD